VNEREGFYRRVLASLVDEGRLARSSRVLVVAGGALDRTALEESGFTDITITNLDPKPGEELQDAESLTYDDDEFDFAIISAGLHHCASPHRALLELYRVGRLGLLALEARDSLLMRAAQRIGVVDEYELTAVAANEFRSGGVRNTSTPNYVYRWTEREVVKTISSAAPGVRHRFIWFREFELPVSVLDASGRSAWRRAALPLRAVTRLFPRQANLFAFAVFRCGLQPWMRDAHSVDADAVRALLAQGKSSRYTRSVARAVEAHENAAARERPRSTQVSGASSTSRTASAIADGSYGSNSRAASPTTSGSAAASEHATGQPQAIASSGGSPKPS
jgi:SAM-dependent methyltransferase